MNFLFCEPQNKEIKGYIFIYSYRILIANIKLIYFHFKATTVLVEHILMKIKNTVKKKLLVIKLILLDDILVSYF